MSKTKEKGKEYTMEKNVLKKIRKHKKYCKKVFTKKKMNDTIRKDYNPLKVNEKFYERGSGLYNMKEIVLEKTIFISEEKYQKIKKEMSKETDYFLRRRTKKIDVILT